MNNSEKSEYEKYRDAIIEIANSTDDVEKLKIMYTYNKGIARGR